MKRTFANEPIPSEGRLLRQVSVRRLNAAIARQVAELAREVAQPLPSSSATAAGDSRRLRGIPALAHGVASTMHGTDPLNALLAKERREKYPKG